MKSLILCFLFLMSQSSFAQAYIPANDDPYNVIKCTLYDYSTIKYYLSTGMLTSASYYMTDPATGAYSERVILESSTLSVLDPFGQGKRYRVEENGLIYLDLTVFSRYHDIYVDAYITHYDGFYDKQSVSCMLEEPAPPFHK